ncbi:GTP-binding signal recognition particle SRP54 G- domain protein [Desulfurococcus amylolyticus DSM 16532]|uniref:Signal recognition particle 54 kDa protein n=2 Tax=Desulfurococcus amylolyticus TaxID=94694 RepID=I3XPS3_DESAM|nr:GTP-binding signal recognition particle SRP54 G- domain protein [Desulfurococcus amylolyticus DSM 16532]
MLMVFDNIRNALTRFLKGGDYEKSVEEFIRELQKELVRADVNLKLAVEITNRIKERALKSEPPPGISRREWFITIVYEELTRLLGGDKKPSIKPLKKPWVIMLVGLQGSGKTTTAAKLAYFYKLEGYKVGLVAADTFRPAAYTQLKQLGEQIGVQVYGEPDNNDAVSIAVKGVSFFIERRTDIIIIDTAGRHHKEEDLLDEMRKISEQVKPDEVILVIDASIGQQAHNIAKKFHETTPIGSIIVTKLDGTAKGGGALSAVAATGAMVKFIGTGEKIDELEVFNPPRFVSRILGLGDIESLVEKVRRLQLDFTEEDAKRLIEGKINMRLVYKQLVSLRKMGPLAKIMQMIPGLGVKLPLEVDPKQLEVKLSKWLAAINSMTYEELENPDIIDKSRIKRIAYGAGVEIDDVRELLKQYELMKKLSKQLRRRDILKKLGIKPEDLKLEEEPGGS